MEILVHESGGNTPGVYGDSLTGVTLCFGPTDMMALESVLEVIQERVKSDEEMPWIYSGKSREHALTAPEAAALWNANFEKYPSSGWNPDCDILISFGPEHKDLLEQAFDMIYNMLTGFIAVRIADAWGVAPEGTRLN